MRSKIKFTAYVVASIDGRIAKDSFSNASWASSEDWKFFQSSLAKHDAVVVGHNTYKISKNRLDKRNTVVFTSKVKKIKAIGSVVFLNPEKENFKKFLVKNKYKKVAILGGPKVYNYFLEHKMLNELFVTFEPIVFSAGVPMFTGEKFKKNSFKLESIKKLNKRGTILLKYRYAS